ncbi:MAG: protoporphyrinogen oxidase [Acidimicrobiales bacterium]
MTEVVVVGGGITGLVAARSLAQAGATVTVVEPSRPGGKMQTTPFAGGVLDEAADAFLARVPEGLELCRQLGLDGDLVSPAERRAHVWSRGALRPLPTAQVLGVPTDLDELAASGIVSRDGLVEAGRDRDRPLTPPDGDVAIGAFMRARLGDEVVDRLIDPLVGGINAGNVDELSLAAAVPQLDAAARSGARSLMEACQVQRERIADPEAPVFFAPRGGMGAIVTALLDDARRLGVTVVSGRVVGLERERRRWRAALDGGRALPADGVVLATPAGTSGGLLRPHAPRAATLLAAIPYASVVLVALAVDRGGIDRELDGSGYLVPRVEGRTITACSWTSTKWPHLGGDGIEWLRASVGRDGDDRVLSLGDEAIVAEVLADLADTMALQAPPAEVRVTRLPRSFPQYRPGHLTVIEGIDADLARAAGTVVVAGAALRGLGVPACIRQGSVAAERLLATLAPRRT